VNRGVVFYVLDSSLRRDRLRAWACFDPSRERRTIPLTPPVTASLSFDRLAVEDRDSLFTSMKRARPARSAFRLTKCAARSRSLSRPRRSVARHLGAVLPPPLGFHAHFRPRSSFYRTLEALLDRSSDRNGSRSAAAAFAALAGGRSVLVNVCRPSDPRARSVGSIEPRGFDLAIECLWCAGRPFSRCT